MNKIYIFLLILVTSISYAQSSGIVIETESGADVYLNGKMVGKTPFNKILNAGNYKIEIKQIYNEHFIKSYSTSTKLISGEIKKVLPEYSINLNPKIKVHLKELNPLVQKYGRIEEKYKDFYVIGESQGNYKVINQSGTIVLHSNPDNYFKIIDEYLLETYVSGKRNKYIDIRHSKVYDKNLKLLFDTQNERLPTSPTQFFVYKEKIYFASWEGEKHGIFSYDIKMNKVEQISTEKYISINDVKDDKIFCSLSGSNNAYILKNIYGKTILSSPYRIEGKFEDGLLPACYPDNNCGYIDAFGKVVIPFIYYDAESFSNGYAQVYKDGKYAIINTNGTIIKNGLADFSCRDLFSDELISVTEDATRIDNNGFINKSGVFVIKPQYYKASHFREGFAIVETRDDLQGIINKQNKLVIPIGVFEMNRNYFQHGELLVYCPKTSRNYILLNKDLK